DREVLNSIPVDLSQGGIPRAPGVAAICRPFPVLPGLVGWHGRRHANQQSCDNHGDNRLAPNTAVSNHLASFQRDFVHRHPGPMATLPQVFWDHRAIPGTRGPRAGMTDIDRRPLWGPERRAGLALLSRGDPSAVPLGERFRII